MEQIKTRYGPARFCRSFFNPSGVSVTFIFIEKITKDKNDTSSLLNKHTNDVQTMSDQEQLNNRYFVMCM